MNRPEECQSWPRLFHPLISGVSLVSALGHRALGLAQSEPSICLLIPFSPFFSLHAPQGQLMASDACQGEPGISQRGLCQTGPGFCFQVKDRSLSGSLVSIPSCHTEALAMPSGQRPERLTRRKPGGSSDAHGPLVAGGVWAGSCPGGVKRPPLVHRKIGLWTWVVPS